MDKLFAGMLIAVAGSQVAVAQGLPVLQQGQLYRVEREKLLASGWQKVITLGLNCVSKYPSSPKTGRFDSFKRETCFKETLDKRGLSGGSKQQRVPLTVNCF
jgi:hypothetical protein